MNSSVRIAILSTALAAAACGQDMHSVANMFKPQATPAESVYHLSLLVLAVCAAIFLVVAGVLAYTIVRFRQRVEDQREPAQVYGSNQIEIAWTVIPILIVFVLTMATARVVSAVQNKRASAEALQITVVGHQWWWEIRYPGLGIVTANELHVPVSTTTKPKLAFLKLESADVAHSFWVPQLAGKTDLIPNRTNSMWIDPKQEGTFLGNCAEYCGTQHANMLLRVIVESQAEFSKWTAWQRHRAVTDARLEAGRIQFLSLSCVNCHAVSGTSAAGTFGPDLSHLMSRDTLAAGVIPNSVENVRAWIKDPEAIKPGSLMPNMQLTSAELDEVVSYLSSLK
ncbi:MAG TPA: cytochrome c oxidase subunit II [Bryobacteraceae bacterium]|jgi:cytochrome c oxidase subunit 2|nr:cytochrome c oxidase subunit II [Bryobacteraceae bacterium]